ncbi:MAG: AraC family transcriptional regulator [Clostridia bacterium]|nr:AraC family transcriptional regulator [Clostridia bacterium]
MNEEILNKLKVITPEEEQFIKGVKNIDTSIYMEKECGVITVKKMLETGKIIDIRPHTRFVAFPEHTHDYVEVIYMCDGTTTHIIDGKQITLKKGELLFLSQSAKQQIMPANFDDVAVNFIIMPVFFDNVLQMLGEEETPLRRFIVDCLKDKNTSGGYLHFEVADVLPVQNLVENLIWTLINDTSNKRNINQITMGLLLLQLINHSDRLNSQNDENRLLVQVLRYIENNYKDGSLYELAEILHYDFSGLSKEIKRHTGKNYTELVQEKRLTQARFLLKNTDMNVDDIAVKVGYSNISYFHRLFRSTYGISPKNFRREER